MNMQWQKTESGMYFRTSDLALAATLSITQKIVALDRQGGKTFFVFRNNRTLSELVSSYWQGEIQIEPQAYFNQLKALKTRLYSDG